MVKKRSMDSSSALAEGNPKRPCADTDNDSDSFEEFFALLQRIEATKRHRSRSRGDNRPESEQKCTEAGRAGNAEAVEAQGLWRPSFEWHDLLPGGNGIRHAESKAGGRNLKKRERLSAEASLDGDGRLDLNLPLEIMPL